MSHVFLMLRGCYGSLTGDYMLRTAAAEFVVNFRSPLPVNSAMVKTS